MSAARLTWNRCPSVTTGGKAYFYHAVTKDGARVGAVVWNRGVRAYAVDYGGRFLGYVDTVPAGKALLRRTHEDAPGVATIAAGMLKRYSRPEVAASMAHDHGCDYPQGDARRVQWYAVRDAIQAQIKGGAK